MRFLVGYILFVIVKYLQFVANRHLKHLTYLDLTACTFALFSIESLAILENLKTLILFNVWPLENELNAICKLKTLAALDISTAYINGNGTYQQPNEVKYLQLP